MWTIDKFLAESSYDRNLLDTKAFVDHVVTGLAFERGIVVDIDGMPAFIATQDDRTLRGTQSFPKIKDKLLVPAWDDNQSIVTFNRHGEIVRVVFDSGTVFNKSVQHTVDSIDKLVVELLKTDFDKNDCTIWFEDEPDQKWKITGIMALVALAYIAVRDLGVTTLSLKKADDMLGLITYGLFSLVLSGHLQTIDTAETQNKLKSAFYGVTARAYKTMLENMFKAAEVQV